MEFTEAQLKKAAAILKTIVVSRDIKIHFGRQQREALKNAAAAGRPIGGYRVKWINSTRIALAATLRKCAEEFDSVYKHDAISILDLQDAILNTLHKLQEITKSAKYD